VKIIRVFPRKTNATPDDENVRFNEPDALDDADEVRVSVAWTWDKERGEKLADAWRVVTKRVLIGGPAYDDPGGEFMPGLYVKRGYVMTSRGCPNHCWFCSVPKREGAIRELQIKDGYNVLDSNLLACSEKHINAVFDMLARQPERPKFTGGLEAARMTPKIAARLAVLKPSSAYFAYDTPDDYAPLCAAAKMLNAAGISGRGRNFFVYVLIGYKNDTFEKAEKRLVSVLRLGLLPMAMLYNRAEGRVDAQSWKRLQREWANKIIVGSKMTNFQKTGSL